MRTKYYTSLLAAAAISLPSLASAQVEVGEPRYGGEVDSSFAFNFTVSRVGSIRGSNGRVVVRATRERFNQRDLIIYVADREGFDVPFGARLVIIAEGSDEYEEGVYIADNRSVPVYNVSDYLSYKIGSEGVVVGNYSESSTSDSENSQTEFVAALRLELPKDEVPSSEGAEGEESGDSITVSGIAKNRYKYTARENRNSVRISESSKTTATSLQGSGRVDSMPTTVTGRITISGSEKEVIDTDD